MLNADASLHNHWRRRQRQPLEQVQQALQALLPLLPVLGVARQRLRRCHALPLAVACQQRVGGSGV